MQTSIKHQLYDLCKGNLLKRIQEAQAAIGTLQSAANEETKSSAGDKYETGRAMMQLEIEKHLSQLGEAQKLLHALEKIKIDNAPHTVYPGSVIMTDQGNYFLAVSTGQFVIEGKTYISISPSSPIGAKLLGLKAGDTCSFNNRVYKIIELC